MALGKYHAILLVMRLYEYLASRLARLETLDALTTDPFEASRRLARNEGYMGRELASRVYSMSWRANLVAYLADYSVHQVLLLAGYYVYVRDQRRWRNLKRSGAASATVEDDDEDDHDGSDRALQRAGTLILSVVKNSTLLALSRAFGLVLSSLGGAIGSLVAPAWGSLAGSQLGDALALAAADEFIGPSGGGHPPPLLSG